MSGQDYVLEHDLLSKGLTQTTRVLGVPMNLVLINVAFFFLLGAICLVCGLPAFVLFFFIAGMVISHLILMIFTVQDAKQIDIAINNKGLCYKQVGATKAGSITQYSPLKDCKTPPITKNPGAFFHNLFFNNLKHGEQESARHVPFTHLHNNQGSLWIPGA